MLQDISWPPKFTLNQENILQLLTGEGFYSDASASLREVVLNAIDAVRRRQADELQHLGAIIVVFDSQTLTLSCDDNGDGMSQQTVTDLFATIGTSASSILGGEARDAIGEFGIGVIGYFMAADEFEIETFDGDDTPIGLRFRKDMFVPGHQAEAFEPVRTERGTTVRMKIRDSATYELVRDQYAYWCREVDHLTAIELPEGTAVSQGGLASPDAPTVKIPLQEGIEKALLSPIATVDAWETMSGSSTITILYRGVFVQEYMADHLWGMTGSIFVDPKHFKPRLNREGFVGKQFEAEINAFLKAAHPAVLSMLVDVLSNALSEGTLDQWTTRRWATLWLLIPREPEYQEAAEKWDSVFRRIPAFELSAGDDWSPAAVDHLVNITGPIHVAPHRLNREKDVVQSAVQLLRQTDQPVLRGLERTRDWLTGPRNYFSTTAELIRHQFQDELPEFIPIAQNAEEILRNLEARWNLYRGKHPVVLVSLGEGSPPVLELRDRLLINIDVDAGRSLVFRTLELNHGKQGLVVAAIEHAPKYLHQVANFAEPESDTDKDVIGLVKRRYIRSLIR